MSARSIVRSAVLLTAFLLLIATLAEARGEWTRLGSRRVNWSADRDAISVTAKEGRFTKLKLKVTGNGVRFRDLKVHFGNGDVQDVPLRAHIPAGGQSRVIDLPGGARVIKKVTFSYSTRGKRSRRATVVLWGRR